MTLAQLLKPCSSFILSFVILIFFSGCYTVQQGYYQAKLILSRQPIDDILAKKSESKERLEKLEMVNPILTFAQEKLSLTPGNSYRHFISLPSNSVTFIVQAAYQRNLERKTWWFPVVGSQPYLGFFEKEDAKKKQKELIDQGFDTTLGGVSAFSLLGFFPDPLYSSMIDNTSIPELAETLIHETLHRTIYIPNFSAFNENLADFVGKKGSVLYLKNSPKLENLISKYQQDYLNEIQMQGIFRTFLIKTKERLKAFYDESKKDSSLVENSVFLKKRQEIFDSISEEYRVLVPPTLKETGYAHAFKKNAFNNAVILGYSLYESKQDDFEVLYDKVGQDIPKFVDAIRRCLKDEASTEDELWQRIRECKI